MENANKNMTVRQWLCQQPEDDWAAADIQRLKRSNDVSLAVAVMAGVDLDAPCDLYSWPGFVDGEVVRVPRSGYVVLETEEHMCLLHDGEIVVDWDNCRYYTVVRIRGCDTPWMHTHADALFVPATSANMSSPPCPGLALPRWAYDMLENGGVQG